MGCRDVGSNFNNMHWHDGQWWCTNGWDYTLEAPSLDLIGERLGDRIANYRISRTDKGTWLATPDSGSYQKDKNER